MDTNNMLLPNATRTSATALQSAPLEMLIFVSANSSRRVLHSATTAGSDNSTEQCCPTLTKSTEQHNYSPRFSALQS
eukprot:2304-Heterococcus_DN1.PRE.3